MIEVKNFMSLEDMTEMTQITQEIYTIVGIKLPYKQARLISFLSLLTNFVNECSDP